MKAASGATIAADQIECRDDAPPAAEREDQRDCENDGECSARRVRWRPRAIT